MIPWIPDLWWILINQNYLRGLLQFTNKVSFSSWWLWSHAPHSRSVQFPSVPSRGAKVAMDQALVWNSNENMVTITTNHHVESCNCRTYVENSFPKFRAFKAVESSSCPPSLTSSKFASRRFWNSPTYRSMPFTTSRILLLCFGYCPSPKCLCFFPYKCFYYLFLLLIILHQSWPIHPTTHPSKWQSEDKSLPCGVAPWQTNGSSLIEQGGINIWCIMTYLTVWCMDGKCVKKHVPGTQLGALESWSRFERHYLIRGGIPQISNQAPKPPNRNEAFVGVQIRWTNDEQLGWPVDKEKSSYGWNSCFIFFE